MSEGRRPTVHGDGLQSRDFTYVANAVQALDEGGRGPGGVGQRLQRRHRPHRTCSIWSRHSTASWEPISPRSFAPTRERAT